MTLLWPWNIPRSWQCQNITPVCYLISFCHIRQCWHGWFEGGVKKPSNPYDISVTSREWFDVGRCWDLGMFQAIRYFSNEQNVSKNNKNMLFPTVLSWYDLAVILKWPYHDLGITPLWYQQMSPCVLGLGSDRVRGLVKLKKIREKLGLDGQPYPNQTWS